MLLARLAVMCVLLLILAGRVLYLVLVKKGIISDWNVSSFDVFQALEHAVTRGDPPLLPEQSISLQVALDAYTINAAYALRQERITGSIEPGKRADLVVVDRDIFALDPHQLHTVSVLATFLDGAEIYSAPAWKPQP